MSSILIHNIGSIATPQAHSAKRLAGKQMHEIHTQSNVAIVAENGVITRIGDSKAVFNEVRRDKHFADVNELIILNAQGMTALPGFVDSHTHTVFGGNRANEFALRAEGKTYEEIAALGGGIISTMNATRAASYEELYAIAKKRLDAMLKQGTTTVEIKSGYGLNTASELKLLDVIAELAHTHPMTIVPTFLGAHAFPPEFRECREKYINIICEEMLPEVKARNLAVFCDIFCEKNYFSLEDSERILTTAQNLGFHIKLHADQLSASGASELGIRMNAISVDHLEMTTAEGVSSIAASETIATALPGASFFLHHSYPPVRTLIDAGATVALATDFNPGSSMTYSMQMMMTLASTQMRMTPEEALTASTLNGAAALMLSHERGSLEVGKKADILLCDVKNFTEVPYHFGENHVKKVIKNGKVVV